MNNELVPSCGKTGPAKVTVYHTACSLGTYTYMYDADRIFALILQMLGYLLFYRFVFLFLFTAKRGRLKLGK